MKEKKSICVVGLGYIGLPTAAVFSMHGVRVIGLDINARVVDTINRGDIHIAEPGLEEVVRNAVEKGMLRASTAPEPADAFLIAVPTPFRGDKHDPDLRYIENATRAIASVLKIGDLIILESTSPVGTTEQMRDWLVEERPDLMFPSFGCTKPDINIAYCPERIMPGRAIHELITNDRVIGGLTPQCAERAAELYRFFVKGECVAASSARTAELTKLTENSFRDVNIAFANELSNVCDHLDIDVWELIALANKHPRVSILQPGPGVGGHCIAVDPWFIVSAAPEQTHLIRTAREVNDHKPSKVVKQVRFLAKQNPEKRIICFGLTFKANIDDLRESPSKKIFDLLRYEFGMRVIALEPNITTSVAEGINPFSIREALESDDILVALVDHNKFKGQTPASKLLVDTIGIWRR